MPKIIHKSSNISGDVPLASELSLGELAINTTDGKIFTKVFANNAESVIGFSLSGSTTQASELPVKVFANDTAMTIDRFNVGLSAWDAYQCTDSPVGPLGGKSFYSGITVIGGNGPRGFQMAVQWNGETGAPGGLGSVPRMTIRARGVAGLPSR